MKLKWPNKTFVVAASLLVASALLYVVGVKLFYWPLLIITLVLYLPELKPFKSAAGRLLYAFLVYFSVTQLIFLVQFLAPVKTDFSVTIIACTFLVVGLMVLRRGKMITWEQWLGMEDRRALIATGVFLVAFLPIFAGSNSIYRIAEIGSGQAIDGTNHFGIIAESLQIQDLNYKVGLYYPRGFHQGIALAESSVVQHQSDFGWRATTIVYLAQYLAFGILLIHIASYLMSAIRGKFKAKERNDTWVDIGLSVMFGLSMALFVLLPFVQHGFMSYFYICGSALAAITVLINADSRSRFVSIIVAQLLFFGSGAAWPLVIPPFLVLTGFFMLNLYRFTDLFKKKLIVTTITFLTLLLLQIIPVAIQVYYSGSSSGDQGLNLTGDLRFFHLGTFILALLGVSWLLFTSSLQSSARRTIVLAIAPLVGFVVALVALQFFTVGEIRYYAIKVHFLVEILVICLSFVILQVALSNLKERDMVIKLFAVAMPFLILFGAYSINTNPFYDLRNLFRTAASQEKPAFFDEDISKYTKLASKGDITKFNSTLVHYDSEKKIYYAHMQLAYWMNMNGYDGLVESSLPSLNCNGKLYSILNFATPSDRQQDDFKDMLRKCIDFAEDNNKMYYIVTDKDSAVQVRSEFAAKSVTIVTE